MWTKALFPVYKETMQHISFPKIGILFFWHPRNKLAYSGAVPLPDVFL